MTKAVQFPWSNVYCAVFMELCNAIMQTVKNLTTFYTTCKYYRTSL